MTSHCLRPHILQDEAVPLGLEAWDSAVWAGPPSLAEAWLSPLDFTPFSIGRTVTPSGPWTWIPREESQK